MEIKTKYKILTVSPDEPYMSGTTWYRQFQPHRFLHCCSNLFEVETINEKDFGNMPDEWFKKFHLAQFVNSHSGFPLAAAIIQIRALGIVTILDVDEYWHLPVFHPLHAQYKKMKYAQQITDAIRQVQCITTPSEVLAGHIIKENENIEIILNGIDPIEYKPEDQQQRPHGIVFGWMGTAAQNKDVYLLEPAINRLYKDYNCVYGKFQFSVTGFGSYEDGAPVKECVEIEKLFTNNYRALITYPDYVKYLKTYTNFAEHYGFNKPYRRHWWRHINEYPRIYNDIDVVLLPQVNTEYNRCKSDIKIAEAGFFRRPAIVSGINPYEDIENRKNGLVISPSDIYGWYHAMKYFIENPAAVKDMGEALYETVKEKYNLRNVSVGRYELYKKLIETNQ